MFPSVFEVNLDAFVWVEMLLFILTLFYNSYKKEKLRIKNDQEANEFPCIRLVDNDEIET